jgi:co-chaperonin GroES (HSP10)
MANDSHSIPGGGDSLARGAPKVTFPGLSKCPPNCECASCRPDMHFVAPEEAEAIPSVVDNSAIFAAKKPSIIYRGTPLNDRILIKRVERESGSSMLVIPDSARGKSDMGIVVSVSPFSQLGLLPNMLILFDKFAAVGQEIELVDEQGISSEHLLVQECDVLLVLEAYKPQQEQGNCVQ